MRVKALSGSLVIVWVNSGDLCGGAVSFGFALVDLGGPSGRRVYSGSRIHSGTPRGSRVFSG